MAWPKTKTAAIYRSKTFQRQRRALVKIFQPGQPCCLCGHPILTARYVEAQHQPGTEKVIGLAHGARNRCPTCGLACNQEDGAARARAAQRARTRTPPPRQRQTRLRW